MQITIFCRHKQTGDTHIETFTTTAEYSIWIANEGLELVAKRIGASTSDLLVNGVTKGRIDFLEWNDAGCAARHDRH